MVACRRAELPDDRPDTRSKVGPPHGDRFRMAPSVEYDLVFCCERHLDEHLLAVRRPEWRARPGFNTQKQPEPLVLAGEPDVFAACEFQQPVEIHAQRHWNDGFDELAIYNSERNSGSLSAWTVCR